MSKNTSISLGSYFDKFIQDKLHSGRYKNVSEIVRAALRLLEQEENKAIVLQKAIEEGIESGIDKNFDPKLHLQKLKANENG